MEYNLRPGFVQDSNGKKCSPITNSHEVLYKDKRLDDELDDIEESINILDSIKLIKTIDITLYPTQWAKHPQKNCYYCTYNNAILNPNCLVEISAESETLLYMAEYRHRWIMADTQCGNRFINIYASNKPTKTLKYTLIIMEQCITNVISVSYNNWISTNGLGNLYKYTVSDSRITPNVMVYCGLDLDTTINFASPEIEGGLISLENNENGKVDIYSNVQFDGNIILYYYNLPLSIPIK